MQRVNVIGTSGSGKSTFSRQLSACLDAPYVEMDALFWKPDWRESTDAEFFERVEQVVAADRWVLDGNYSRTRPIKWARVDTIVWLDFGFWRTLRQILRRSIRRARSRQEIWQGTGNRESFRRTFASHESVVLWMLSSYRRNRRRYAQLMESPELAHVRFERLRSPADADRFLSSISSTRTSSRTS